MAQSLQFWDFFAVSLRFLPICTDQREPLIFTFDEREGRRVVVTWNRASIDPSLVEELLVRPAQYVDERDQFGGIKKVMRYGQWDRFISGPLSWNFTSQFVKQRFCNNYEFCVLLNRNAVNSPAAVGSNQFVVSQREDCWGNKQILGIPPVELDENVAGLAVQRIDYNPLTGDRITVQISRNLQFKYWNGAVLRNLRASVTSDRCDRVPSANVRPPEVVGQGDVVLFDRDHALHDCTFLYTFTAELARSNEQCSVVYTLPLTQALRIKLSCELITGLDCATASATVRSQGCFDCSPRITSEASVDWTTLDGSPTPILKVAWEFPHLVRAGQSPSEYRLRYSKSDIDKDFKILRSGIDQVEQTIPYTRRSITLPAVKDQLGFAHPAYLLQVCAIYERSCSQAIRWDDHDRYPIRMEDFRAKWTAILGDFPQFQDSVPGSFGGASTDRTAQTPFFFRGSNDGISSWRISGYSVFLMFILTCLLL